MRRALKQLARDRHGLVGQTAQSWRIWPVQFDTVRVAPVRSL